jgi:hypothetical protein
LWRASVELDVSGAGSEVDVVLRMDERHWYAVRVAAGSACAVIHIGDIEQETAPVPADTGATVFVSAVPARNRGPDDVVLAIESAGVTTELARVDGRYLSSEVAGGFTGRVLGAVARAGEPRVRRFAYTPG